MATELAFQVQRHSTIDAHRQAVERVISEMRARFDEPLTLRDMARIACLSPFHFDRVFHQITGLPAVQFLYALRIEAAKRMLLTTTLSITDVCYDVGYNSLGTFTSRFTQLVGLSPRHFRRLANKVNIAGLESLLNEAIAVFQRPCPNPAASGRIIAPDNDERLIFVGLFPECIPQSRPIGGTLLRSAGHYWIGPALNVQCYIFAAALPRNTESLAYLLPAAGSLLVGVSERGPSEVKRPGNSVDVTLRSVEITDPPILIALPLLLTEVATEGLASV